MIQSMIPKAAQNAAQKEPPKIEFPCANYPVKVVGVGHDDYVEVVFSMVQVHAPDCDFTRIHVRESAKGSFRSLTLYITATGVDQLERLHTDLMAHPYVRMVI